MTLQMTPENIVREKLIKKYHEYGFAKHTGGELSTLSSDIAILEEVANEICDAKGIEFKAFIFPETSNEQ